MQAFLLAHGGPDQDCSCRIRLRGMQGWSSCPSPFALAHDCTFKEARLPICTFHLWRTTGLIRPYNYQIRLAYMQGWFCTFPGLPWRTTALTRPYSCQIRLAGMQRWFCLSPAPLWRTSTPFRKPTSHLRSSSPCMAPCCLDVLSLLWRTTPRFRKLPFHLGSRPLQCYIPSRPASVGVSACSETREVHACRDSVGRLPFTYGTA